MSLDDPATSLALVGSAIRFPGASDLDGFWENILAGRSAITRFDPGRLEADSGNRDHRDHPDFIAAGAVIEDPEYFDAGFFGMSAREALITDPQQRLFLQCCWHALEDAGCVPARFDGRIGVFAGCSISSYLLAAMARGLAPSDLDPLELLMANDKDYLATRVAYKLNLKGPALTLQTACSTSLVALHVACQSLLNGECDAALVGGATVLSPQRTGYVHVPGGILSPEALCRPFDKAGNGTVFGSGVAAVLLKRLEDAVGAGDPIQTVILGSAVNNDGDDKVGYTAPSVSGQAEVIAEAMTVAGISPDRVGYIEGHGTGTELGDPVEVAALTRAFALAGGKDLTPGSCALGSVKGNLGHLDAAAGLAGLLKAALALRRGVLPPLANFRGANPALALESTPFRIETEAAAWPASQNDPRIAGVSSFGVGGTNAHVVLATSQLAPAPLAPAQLSESPGRKAPSVAGEAVATWLPVTAASKAALLRRLEDLADAVDAPDQEITAGDWAGTLGDHRQILEHRLAVPVPGAPEANGRLSDAIRAAAATLARHPCPKAAKADKPPLCFLFPGQGSQYPGMAGEAWRRDPDFAARLDSLLTGIGELTGRDLRGLLLESDAEAARDAELRRTDNAQLAIFAVSLALAETWMARGLAPALLIGHSLGEITAATLAGVFRRDDALAVVAKRGELMGSAAPGAMLAVAAPPDALREGLPAELDLAAINGPELVTLGGPERAVDAYEARLGELGFIGKRLATSHAFHGRSMTEASEAFADFLADLPLRPPQRPLLSNLRGGLLSAEEAQSPAYWAEQIRQPVRFMDNLAAACSLAPDLAFLEMGAGRTLCQILGVNRPEARSYAPLAVSAAGPYPQRLHADLWSLGHGGLAPLAIPKARRRAPVPPYPFARERYWLLDGAAAASPADTADTAGAALAPRPEIDTAYRAPETERQERLCRIFAEVLCLERIGIDDNFFEIGGSSIIALQIARKCRDGGLVLAPRQLFDSPSIAQLSEAVAESRRLEADPERLPLSPWQQRALGFAAASGRWPEPLALRFRTTAPLDPARLSAAAGRLRRRHRFLRTTFRQDGAAWQQTLLPAGSSEGPEVEILDLSDPMAVKAALSEMRPGGAPLFRIFLSSKAEDPELLIALHPLICDQGGQRLLLAELYRFYNDAAAGREDEAVPTAFAPWCQAQERRTPASFAEPLATARRLELRLDAELTRLILEEATAVFRIPGDLAIAACLLRSPLFEGRSRQLFLELAERGLDEGNADAVAPYQGLHPVDIAGAGGDRLAVLREPDGGAPSTRRAPAAVLRYGGPEGHALPPGFEPRDDRDRAGGSVVLGGQPEITAERLGDRLRIAIENLPPEDGVSAEEVERHLRDDLTRRLAARGESLSGAAFTDAGLDDEDVSALLERFN